MQTIPKSKVECVVPERMQLGESPVWSVEENCLYWIDIQGCRFNRFDPSTGENISIETAERFGSIALREQGGYIAATESGFKLYDAETNSLTLIGDPEESKPHVRLNDGRCDRAGRFWAGGMVEKGPNVPDAALYSVDSDHSIDMRLDDFILANGLAWSPDNKTMYFADTRNPHVWTFDFDLESGNISNRQVFLEFGEEDGIPDGAAIDNEGCYWLAQPWAGKVCRYTPAGKIDTVVEVPASRPTMCAFGGPTLNTLYITTNSTTFGEAEMAKDPLAGRLFAVELTAQGLPEPKFAG